jgi:hypothetical protein
MSAWYLYKIGRVERRRRDHERRREAVAETPAGHDAPRPGSAPMLAMIGGSVAVCGLVMTAGVGLAVLAFVREDVGSSPFWGWMGAAFGCLIGGAGGVAGSWNSYRQMTGRGDFMSDPGTTPFDRALGVYTLLGVLVLMATGVTWRAVGREVVRPALPIPADAPAFPEPGSYAEANWFGRWVPSLVVARRGDAFEARHFDGFQHTVSRSELRPLRAETPGAWRLLGLPEPTDRSWGRDTRLFGLILGGLMAVQGASFLAIRSVTRKTTGGPAL